MFAILTIISLFNYSKPVVNKKAPKKITKCDLHYDYYKNISILQNTKMKILMSVKYDKVGYKIGISP